MTAPVSRKSPLSDSTKPNPAILIVEDEILIRFAISAYLQECGFRVYEAGDAVEAIQILELDRAAIDLVFSDVAMPGDMDGFGLAQWIRKNRPGMAVVLTSGDAKKSAAAKDLCENGPFFAKPYNIAQVVAQIRSLIEAKTQKPDA